MSNYRQLLDQVQQLDRDSLLKLSGFIEALTLTEADPKKKASSSVASQLNQPSVVVAFASQTGNSETIAHQLGVALGAHNHKAKIINIAELSVKKMASISYLFIIASTHGEGDPPDLATQFHSQLNSNRAPPLNNLRFAIIALGDQTYEQFCGFGLWLDERLSSLGAQQLKACELCDVDYQPQVDQWIAQLKDILPQEDNTAALQVTNGSTPPALTSPYNAQNPLLAEVISNVNLCTERAQKSVHHLELEVPFSAIPYEPGDSLGIVVDNPPQMVEDILKQIDFPADSPVLFNKDSLSLEDCLSSRAELFRITSKQLTTLCEIAPNRVLKDAIKDQPHLSDFIFSHDWLSLFQTYSKKGTKTFSDPQQLVDLLNPCGHRLYSISSSPLAHENEVHLSIRLREFGEEKRLGLVSNSISSLSEGDQLRAYLKPNKNFRLPEDTSTPLIFIGTGTGIAPFRSFLYHRMELGIQSPVWLFFGEQLFRESFLYQTDWLKFLNNGVLSKLTVAFSRDPGRQSYVQDKLLENAKELYQWIDEGAHIYVCGSADRMAPSVNQALQRVISDQLGVDQTIAAHKLQQLMIEGAYKRDIY